MLVALLAIAAAALPYVRPSASAQAPEMRLDVRTPPTTDPMSFALSPDGRYIVFAATDGTAERLWLRRLDVTTPQPLAGTEGAAFPFWAPNSRSVGFFAEGKLKRLDVDGGAPQILADAVARGGAWGPDGTIVFPARGGLLLVSASGGRVVEVTSADGERTSHRAPQFLPDGRRFLLFVRAAPEAAGIYLGSLDSPGLTRLTAADAPGLHLPSGWVMFPRGGTLLAQRLDLERGALAGDPVTVADSVDSSPIQVRSAISVSSNGLIAYRTPEAGLRQLSWFDRSGTPLGVLGAPDASGLSCPRLSLDGVRVAVHRTVQRNQDIWLLDGTRTTRFTVDAGFDQCPVWSPDGRFVVFDSNRAGARDLYLRAANGAGDDRAVVTSTMDKLVTDWSRDGRFLAYEQNPGDLWIAPRQGGGRPFVFLKTDFQELEAKFSPDGRWVAYKSNESGQFEVYVRPFSGTASPPEDAGQSQVSSDGGINPRWRADGRELYYVAPDGTLMAVPMAVVGSTLTSGAPVALFRPRIVGGGAAFSTQYDVARDGRFLINTVVDETAPPLTIIQNWKPPAQ
jgi:Tol biopolymer transport system component